MFHIELDRVLLEIGTNTSELYDLKRFGPDTHNIFIITNYKNKEVADTLLEEVLKKYYPRYNFEILFNNYMPSDEARVTLVPKIRGQ